MTASYTIKSIKSEIQHLLKVGIPEETVYRKIARNHKFRYPNKFVDRLREFEALRDKAKEIEQAYKIKHSHALEAAAKMMGFMTYRFAREYLEGYNARRNYYARIISRIEVLREAQVFKDQLKARGLRLAATGEMGRTSGTLHSRVNRLYICRNPIDKNAASVVFQPRAIL